MKFLYLALLSVLLFTSCQDDDENSNPIYGKWKYKKGKTIMYNPDGSFFSEDEGEYNNSYCDADLEDAGDLSNFTFCKKEDETACASYIERENFFEITKEGFKDVVNFYSENLYYVDSHKHVMTNSSTFDQCLFKVSEKVISEYTGDFIIDENLKVIKGSYLKREFVFLEKSHELKTEDQSESEDKFYEKGERDREYFYEIMNDGMLKIDVDYVDYYRFVKTIYLEKVD